LIFLKDSAEHQDKVRCAVAELKKSIQLDSLYDKSLAMHAYIKNSEEIKKDSAAILYENTKQVQPHGFSYAWILHKLKI
jgi:predicted phage-related endonuclease